MIDYLSALLVSTQNFGGPIALYSCSVTSGDQRVPIYLVYERNMEMEAAPSIEAQLKSMALVHCEHWVVSEVCNSVHAPKGSWEKS